MKENMKKAVSIAIIIVIILTLCSCSANKTPVISSIFYSDSEPDGFTYSKKFSYNKDGNISEIVESYAYTGVPDDHTSYDTSDYKTVFEYDDNGFPQKSITYRDGEIIYWYDYECNSMGKIIEARKYDSDSFRFYIEYIYNSDGTLSVAYIYSGYSGDLCCKVEYSYNDAGNIIYEKQSGFYSFDYISRNFSYSYSPDSDSKLMSFNRAEDNYSELADICHYAFEYDSAGNLTKVTGTSLDPEYSGYYWVETYQHTVIDVTEKTNLFMSDSGSYYNPYFGVFIIQHQLL